VPEPSETRIVASLVAVQVLFGALAVASKIVLPDVPPLALALCRLLAATVVLFALERTIVRSPFPGWREAGRFALFALLGVVLNQGLFLLGTSMTSATHAVLLIATIPAFTLLVAVVLGHERMRAFAIAGLAVSFAGVAFLVLGTQGGEASILGDALVALNSLSYSTYLVLSRPSLKRHDPLTLIAWVFLLGTIEMLPFALPQALHAQWSALGTREWIAFAYILLGATVGAYGLNTWVLRYASAPRVASFVYLQPLVGVLLAVALRGEAVTWRVGVAGLLILAGVFVANQVRPSNRAAAPAE
jgi:drug/metabolite transporter (DMT)-like permease